MTRTDAEACNLTPCGNPLAATTGRSQASVPAPFEDLELERFLVNGATGTPGDASP